MLSRRKGFFAKKVSNIINRKKEPHPLFRVELEPDSSLEEKRSAPHL